jgi:nucleoside-diphosphate-sugar epimerase
MTALVTGGGGFVGINLVEQLVAEGERVVVFDQQFPTAARELMTRRQSNVEIVTGDVRDAGRLDAVFNEFDIKLVVHAAVITSDAAREVRDPKEIVEVNVLGTVNVLRHAQAANCERVIYVSSGQAYGKTHDEGLRLYEEVSPSRPEDVYGITKFAAERLGLRLGELWKLPVVCVRLGSVFGPWEFGTGVRDMLSPFLQTAALAVLGKTAVISAREVWRDWIYSRDVAAGISAALRGKSLQHRLYHLASGMDWRGSFAEWCNTLRQAYPRFSWRTAGAKEQPNISFLLSRDRAPMDITRATEDLHFNPRFGPSAAYPDYVEWIRKHEDFVANARGIP